MTTPSDPLIRQLQHALRGIEDGPVECDGFARLATTVLCHLGIEHTVYCGGVEAGDPSGDAVPYHFWLVCESAQGPVLVDYRLRMWLGAAAPHGAFRAARTEDGFAVDSYRYLGKPILMPVLPDNLFALLAANTDLPRVLAQARQPISG